MKLIIACVFICFTTMTVRAQHRTNSVLHTSSDQLKLYLDGQKDEFNGINKLGSHFSYAFVVPNDSLVIALVSETDSVSQILRPKKKTVFQIVRATRKDTVTCTFTLQKPTKPATFSDQYKTENEGKAIIETPEVYELVNIIFALTEYGKTNAIYKNTDYYKSVASHFAPYRGDAAVRTIDSLLKVSPGFYYLHLKMDSYAYVFSGDKIINGGVYDRVATGDRNELDDYLPIIQTFAEKSGFRNFYKKNLNYYAGLRKDYRDNIDIAGMKLWLGKQFPATRYSAIKVIFSPLVGWNQSAGFFNDNGFTEAQAHVNFPFIDKEDTRKPAGVVKGRRMMIAFTEINHAFLNPEAEKHGKTVANAFKDLSKWTTAGKPAAGYDNAMLCFEEYMNYGLVTLYYSDIFDPKTFESLRAEMESNMVGMRGFQKFQEFNQELLRLYQAKKPTQTVADLYPAIIDWASRQD